MRYKQIVDMARQAGAWPELSETLVKDVAFLTRFAEIVRVNVREECAENACDAIAFSGGSVQMESYVRQAILAGEQA